MLVCYLSRLRLLVRGASDCTACVCVAATVHVLGMGSMDQQIRIIVLRSTSMLCVLCACRYAGEITMPHAVKLVSNTPRGTFLVRRSRSNKANFHLVVSIFSTKDTIGVGKYVLEYRDNMYHLSGRPFKSIRSLIKMASGKNLLQDAHGACRLKKTVYLDFKDAKR
eukprot:m.1130459 g.1130459  ORF g.1130459 m.1130459 type:complete len:166 (+) comp24422_c0_seq9:2617-3114(+)